MNNKFFNEDSKKLLEIHLNLLMIEYTKNEGESREARDRSNILSNKITYLQECIDFDGCAPL